MTKLGHKFLKSAKKLGHKIDMGAHRLGHKANIVLNKIDKGIGQADTAIRKTDNTLNKAISLGVGNVPYVGQALNTASNGVHALRGVSKTAKHISSTARGHAQDLEKFNSRKAVKEALTGDSHGSFV